MTGCTGLICRSGGRDGGQMVPETKACHACSTRSGPRSGDCCYLHHHLHLRHRAGQEQAWSRCHCPPSCSLGTHLQGATAGGNDKASLAGSSMKGQKQRVVDGRSQLRSWSHGLESHPEGFPLGNPLTGSMQPVSKETQRERNKSQGGRGDYWAGLFPSRERQCSLLPESLPRLS